ncbi:MAG: hypothetical protein GXO85_16660 [Chlorobi bacterium]|nr:hypothetical protein [Chlorobiota bacterium]
MSIIELANAWLRNNYPSDISNSLRVSKYHSPQDLWFFTLPTSYFDSEKKGNLNILLQYENDHDQFHFLKVPFSFLRTNRNKLDIRSTGDQFDIHISAKKSSWLVCTRSDNVSFSEYKQ